MNKYRLNQLVLVFNLVVFLCLQYFISIQLNWLGWFTLPVLLIIGINLHYFLNALHLATHNQLSKLRKLNNFLGRASAIFGGLNFAEFSSTHLQHHAFPGDPEKDPDFLLTKSGSLLFLPFKIWQKDRYFFQSKLCKKEGYTTMYFQDRIIQIAIILLILLSGKIQFFLIYYTIPSLIVGLAYGFYLFYFPHYISKWETLMSEKKFNFNVFKLVLFSINLSRFYHTQHHFKVHENRNYYPLYSYLSDKMNNRLSPEFSTIRNFTQFV